MTRSRLRLPPAFVLLPAGQRGMTLIEVLIALGIIAAVAVTFLAGMSASSSRVIINSENITAESLAKTQMEYVKRQPYDAIGTPEYAELVLDPDLIAADYAIDVAVQLMNPKGDSPNNDDGLQMIIITIKHHGNTVHTLEGYKSFTGQ